MNAFYAAIGVLVEAVNDGLDALDLYNDRLDAIAYLLIDHAQTRRRHNRDLRDEQREAQAAYREGRDDGARDTRGAGW